jgi:sec-independent protein translocase protein TatB
LFDLSITKILILGLLGLMIFGPEQLPRMAAQAGQALRDLRKIADKARADLSESLGPEFSDFDFNDLNPRAFVRKHLLEGDAGEDYPWADSAEVPVDGGYEPERLSLSVGEIPPYDADAT